MNSRLCSATQHFDDQPCPLAKGLSKARAVAHKAALLRQFRPLMHGRKTEFGDVLYECAGVDREEWGRQKNERVCARCLCGIDGR